MNLSRHIKQKQHVVIVKGNPKYLDDPKIRPMADKFYGDLKQRLEDRGFEVTFDPGVPETLPDTSAYAWVAHSRGIDRLDWAPDKIKTLALETKSPNDGDDPKHYQLSSVDIAAIRDL